MTLVKDNEEDVIRGGRGGLLLWASAEEERGELSSKHKGQGAVPGKEQLLRGRIMSRAM